jgi:hypothetical protein
MLRMGLDTAKKRHNLGWARIHTMMEGKRIWIGIDRWTSNFEGLREYMENSQESSRSHLLNRRIS